MTTEEIIERARLDWYRDNNRILLTIIKEKDNLLRKQETEILQLRKELDGVVQEKQGEMERVSTELASRA